MSDAGGNDASHAFISSLDLLSELRGYWQFAAVCQFLHLFHTGLKLDEFETQDLENQLISDPPDPRLVDLNIHLIKCLIGALNSRFITRDNWQASLGKEWAKRSGDAEVWGEDSVYHDVPLRSKVLILHCLCEWQFDNSERLRAPMEDGDEVEWRVDPVGQDSRGNTYWLFDDNRLYREAADVPPKRSSKKARQSKSHPEPSWALASFECATIEDWEAFPARFKSSRSLVEKQFHAWLEEDALPKLLRDLQDKEKQRRIEEALSNRKRSSRLQMREFEEEEKLRVERVVREAKQSERLARQAEAKARKDEQERTRRLEAREQRIAEREARLHRSTPSGFSSSPSASNASHHIPGRSVMPTLDEVAAAQSKHLKQTSPDRPSATAATGASRSSKRKRKQQQVEEENQERWYFDCVCGVHGDNLDDGSPMIACERCNVWQHIACLARADTTGVGGGDGHSHPPQDLARWEKEDYVCLQCQKHTTLLASSQQQQAEQQRGQEPTGFQQPSSSIITSMAEARELLSGTRSSPPTTATPLAGASTLGDKTDAGQQQQQHQQQQLLLQLQRRRRQAGDGEALDEEDWPSWKKGTPDLRLPVLEAEHDGGGVLSVSWRRGAAAFSFIMAMDDNAKEGTPRRQQYL
ncbi:hypothetical protein HKX48_006622 [Thoreauomyces humboldtii]|nr:hypothetical protein HKX48_006622 [Thoreauomyces humboldtii]